MEEDALAELLAQRIVLMVLLSAVFEGADASQREAFEQKVDRSIDHYELHEAAPGDRVNLRELIRQRATALISGAAVPYVGGVPRKRRT